MVEYRFWLISTPVVVSQSSLDFNSGDVKTVETERRGGTDKTGTNTKVQYRSIESTGLERLENRRTYIS